SCGSPVVTSEEEVQHCVDHVASTRSSHHHHRFRSFNVVVPEVPSKFHSADHFESIEGLRQYVPGAEIQSFNPKALVGKLRRYDQIWWMVHGLNVSQQVDPRPRHQITFTKNYGDFMPLHQVPCGREFVSFQERPSGWPDD